MCKNGTVLIVCSTKQDRDFTALFCADKFVSQQTEKTYKDKNYKILIFNTII